MGVNRVYQGTGSTQMGVKKQRLYLQRLKQRTIQACLSMAEVVLWRWGLLLILAGVLLGRAAILTDLYPFALPFFAVVFAWKRNRAWLAGAALLIGASWGMLVHLPYLMTGLLVFILGYVWVEKRTKQRTKSMLPLLVLVSTSVARAFTLWLTSGGLNQVPSYDWIMLGVESFLAFVLTMIFVQSLPLLMHRKRKAPLTNEEMICFIILIASVLTGAIGWMVYGLHAEHILARYLVLLFAFVGGASIGATVGVVTGLILSLASVANLYQMSLLAFAGLLGGLMKEGKKIGVSAGLLVGTLLIALYGEGLYGAELTMAESAVAVAMFLLTPTVLTSYMAKYIPGTLEHSNEQRQYLKKMRSVTASRVETFSQLFQTLSSSFSLTQPLPEAKEKEMDQFLSNVTERTCQSCFRKEKCWVQGFNQTYEGMTTLTEDLEHDGKIRSKTTGKWRKLCYYPERVSKVMEEEWDKWQFEHRLNRHVEESRKLVADQLQGVSKVMEDFAREMNQEKEAHYLQEQKVHDALIRAGADVDQIEIYDLTPRRIDVEMNVVQANHGESEKVIAPMLSDILEDHIVVESEEVLDKKGMKRVRFGSARTYTVSTGVATVAKGGAWVSGDSHTAMDVGAGKYAVAISDGMGNGRRANEESRETLSLLKNILQSGMNEAIATKTINSILSLRTTEEMFSTLDLAMIDLQTADVNFVKVGSVPAFIKRDQEVRKVEANNLPMGVFATVEVDMVEENLQDGDQLIMMSDGVLDNVHAVENKEIWLKRLIRQMDNIPPQEVADVLLEEVIRASNGAIEDDMTIVVTTIERNNPEWAAIPVWQYYA
nr:stage II sporulation protein E [Salsuginibacillus kocurii]